MSTTLANETMTPLEYLAREAVAETKSEYVAGTMRAMAGASPEHVTICFNLAREVGLQIRRTTCRGSGGDMRVWIEVCERYYYSDLSITCSSPQFEMRMGLRALVNPAVIVEVISATTEAIDRGEKFLCYQEMDSLSAYVLIAQATPRIEVFTRGEEGEWPPTVAVGLGAEILLPVANCTLRLADIYVDVDFSGGELASEGSGVRRKQILTPDS